MSKGARLRPKGRGKGEQRAGPGKRAEVHMQGNGLQEGREVRRVLPTAGWPNGVLEAGCCPSSLTQGSS